MYEDPPPAMASRIVRRLFLWAYKTLGWTAEGAPPADRRCVIIAVPHTSNWDFLFFLGLTDALGIKAHFMGKDSLFRWPMGGSCGTWAGSRSTGRAGRMSSRRLSRGGGPPPQAVVEGSADVQRPRTKTGARARLPARDSCARR